MISVLLPAYCGEAFLGAQLASVLPQLRGGDELLVSDDSPEGEHATRDVALSFGDPRIRYLVGPRQGVVKNVEFLLTQARGNILVLCDQDDVWLPGKLSRTCTMLAGEPVALLHHNATICDAQLRMLHPSLWAQTGARPGVWRNLCKNGYTGCCMAFTRGLLPYILPFPPGIPMHDQWIGLQAERHAPRGDCVLWLEEPFLLWRRHEGTQTGRKSTLRQKIAWRTALVQALLARRAAGSQTR
jgi:glycosyltransferase involved in cell wall biosynthesis